MSDTNMIQSGLVKKDRRNFLRLLALGTGVFAFGGFLSKLDTTKKPVASKSKDLLSGFRVVESKKELAFLNKKGEELFILEKEA